jgi:hypothetical protein
VATRRRTRENKGHVNYDLSDVPVKAHAAPTMGSGCHSLVSACAGQCEKLFIFSVRAREGGSAKYTLPCRHRACREGSWDGGGVLLALGTASCLVEDTTCQRDENVIVVASFLVAGGSIFTPWERRTPNFGDVVARASDTPVPLRQQNREHNLASWQAISHRGQF